VTPEKLHRAQNRCPVCGSESRTKPTLGLAREKQPEYVRALARGLGVPVEVLIEPLTDHSCARCGTVYMDPALDDTATNQLFINYSPIHNWGWGRFAKKLLWDPQESGKIEDLEAFVRAEIGLPESYLEVGCPFGGFAIMWADAAKMRAAAKSPPDQNFYSQEQYRRLLRVNLKIMRLSMIISSGLTRFWFALTRLKRGAKSSDGSGAPEIRLAFLAQYSMNRWSYGCRAFGLTCTEMASRGMGADVLSLGRLRQMPANSFELAGMINSLDHSDEPLELLMEVTRVSQRVIVAGHRLADAHIQHRFALSDETMPRLALEHGLLCQDISSVLDDASAKWFAYLLARA